MSVKILEMMKEPSSGGLGDEKDEGESDIQPIIILFVVVIRGAMEHFLGLVCCAIFF